MKIADPLEEDDEEEEAANNRMDGPTEGHVDEVSGIMTTEGPPAPSTAGDTLAPALTPETNTQQGPSQSAAAPMPKKRKVDTLAIMSDSTSDKCFLSFFLPCICLLIFC